MNESTNDSPRIVTWSIVNNEIDFIADVIDYHVSWTDTMYVLDTGSTDGTLDVLRDKAKNNPKLIVEEYHTKYSPEYDTPWEEMANPFPEVEVRNYAIDRCKVLCQPDWLIQLDGDEVFLSNTRELIKNFPKTVALNHSTLNPACDPKTHRQEFRFGHYFYDPHARIWNAKYSIEYMKNHQVGGKQFHCNPTIRGWNRHLFETPGVTWIKDHIHLHLHWFYGKKMESFFHKKGIVTKEQLIARVPANQFATLLPSSFLQKRKTWEQIELNF